MKPTFQFNRTSRQRDAFASNRKRAVAPRIEYFFQPPSPEFSGHRSGDNASFRSISREYFQREARAHYATEALAFGLIAIIAAIPVIESVRALAQFVYGVL